MTEKAFFQNQLNKLNTNITQNSILLGDFNLDLNKIDDPAYGKNSYFDNITNTIGHHNLEQMVHEDTWNRIINRRYVSSRIDHVYTTCPDDLKQIAAVWCSPVTYRLGAGGIWVWDDGQAGPCMASVHGWCMASVHGAGWVGGGVAYYYH